MLNIVFFAALREQLQTEKLALAFDKSHATIGEIKTQLCEANPSWQDALLNNTVLNAVNHTMVADDFTVNDGDEVAFFPPVTGG